MAKVHIRVIQRRLLDTGRLSVDTQPLSSVTHGKELYNMNSPSASPVTIVRIIHLRMRVPRIAAATIQGRVCKTFVVLQKVDTWG